MVAFFFFQIRHKQMIYLDQHYLPCSALVKRQFFKILLNVTSSNNLLPLFHTSLLP